MRNRSNIKSSFTSCHFEFFLFQIFGSYIHPQPSGLGLMGGNVPNFPGHLDRGQAGHRRFRQIVYIRLDSPTMNENHWIKPGSKYTINEQCIIYGNHSIETIKRKITQSQGGMSESSPLRSGGWRDSQTGRLDLVKGSQRHSKLSKLKGGPQVRVNPDQMVLVMARRETGPCWQWPKALGGRVGKQQ